MARPIKIGLDYFPLETDFFERDDVNLLVAEFGWKGAIVYLGLLTRIYKNGYFYQWGEDVCLLFCKKMGAGLVPAQVNEVIKGCIRRSLFNKGVFDMFNILTSETIQQTYLDAKQKSTSASIDERFCLIQNKTEKTPELIPKKPELIPKKPELIPNLVHKAKQSKEKKSKESIANAGAAAVEENLFDAFVAPMGQAFSDTGSDTAGSPPTAAKPLAAMGEIGIKAEFTIVWSWFAKHREFTSRKNKAQDEWCKMSADERALRIMYLEECTANGTKPWTENPLYYIMYFDDHITLGEYKIPHREFYSRGLQETPEYCILKERDENGSIYFCKTKLAQSLHWEIERICG